MKLNAVSCKKLIFIQLGIEFFITFFIELFKLPSSITFLTDIINIVLCLYMVWSRKNIFRRVDAKPLEIILLVLVGFIVVSATLNLVYPQYFLWGCRKYFRGIIFFVACVRFLDSDDYEKILEFTFWLQIVNLLISLYQFFVLNLRQDFLGGIFGTSQGCNAYSNVFFFIIVSFYISRYLRNRKYLPKMLFIIISCLLLAALAELKIFFLEFALILLLELYFSKPSFKKIVICIISVITFIVAMAIFEKLFPSFYARMTNLADYISIGRDIEEGAYNISRIGAFRQVNELFLHTPFQRFFGLGLGNCENAPVDFLISPFFKKYGRYNYLWFGHTTNYMETGWIGTTLLLMIFAYHFIYSLIKEKKCAITFCYDFVFIKTLIIIITANYFYNNFIRDDIQYIVYFVLAMPYVIWKETKQTRRKQVEGERNNVQVDH